MGSATLLKEHISGAGSEGPESDGPGSFLCSELTAKDVITSFLLQPPCLSLS